MKMEFGKNLRGGAVRLGVICLLSLVSFSSHAHNGKFHESKKNDSKTIEASAEKSVVFKEINAEYEKNIKPIFNNKCADCHSSEIKSPWYSSIPVIHRIIESDRIEAKKHLELSKGFPFGGHGTPDEDLLAIAEAVEKNTMPTKLYLFFHPSAEITKDEKEKILTWVKGSQVKLANINK